MKISDMFSVPFNGYKYLPYPPHSSIEPELGLEIEENTKKEEKKEEKSKTIYQEIMEMLDKLASENVNLFKFEYSYRVGEIITHPKIDTVFYIKNGDDLSINGIKDINNILTKSEQTSILRKIQNIQRDQKKFVENQTKERDIKTAKELFVIKS